MVELTRLNGQKIVINVELIESMGDSRYCSYLNCRKEICCCRKTCADNSDIKVQEASEFKPKKLRRGA